MRARALVAGGLLAVAAALPSRAQADCALVLGGHAMVVPGELALTLEPSRPQGEVQLRGPTMICGATLGVDRYEGANEVIMALRFAEEVANAAAEWEAEGVAAEVTYPTMERSAGGYALRRARIATRYSTHLLARILADADRREVIRAFCVVRTDAPADEPAAGRFLSSVQPAAAVDLPACAP